FVFTSFVTFFFFFQAEDGIRDATVTGVQTCALPIYTRREKHCLGNRVRDEDDSRAGFLPDAQQLRIEPLTCHLVERAERFVHQRSEERRVGKECRSRRERED